jgi:hypothetical protein
MQYQSAAKEVALVASALCISAALFWWLGAAFGILLAGLALCLALAFHWRQKKPLRWKGSEIKFEERPFVYHVCAFSIALFPALFLAAGIVAIWKGTS